MTKTTKTKITTYRGERALDEAARNSAQVRVSTPHDPIHEERYMLPDKAYDLIVAGEVRERDVWYDHPYVEVGTCACGEDNWRDYGANELQCGVCGSIVSLVPR